jgi:hypothetical protein
MNQPSLEIKRSPAPRTQSFLSKLICKAFGRAKFYNLILTQDSAFDVMAALSMGLTRLRVRHRFVYPYPTGPLQKNAKTAREFLNSYGLDQKLFWDSKRWSRRLFTPMIIRNSIANIVQTPYLREHFSPRFLTILRSANNLTYTNYGLNLDSADDYHFQLDSYSDFFKILVSSEVDLQGFKYAGVVDEKLAFIGNPLSFEIRFGDNPHVSNEKRDSINLLWAPHWTKTWSNWEETLPKIQELLDSDLKFKLTFRPHPLLLPGIKGDLPPGYQVAQPLNPKSARALDDFLRHKNVNLSTSSLISDINENDILLTDGVSIIGFWSITGKPMAIFRRPDSPQFSSQISQLEKSLGFIHQPFDSLGHWVSTHAIPTPRTLNDYSTLEIVYHNESPIEPAKLLLQAFQSSVD